MVASLKARMRSKGTLCRLTVANYMIEYLHVRNWLIDVRFLHVFFFLNTIRVDLFDLLTFNYNLLVSHF